jgi:hypothetical protein
VYWFWAPIGPGSQGLRMTVVWLLPEASEAARHQSQARLIRLT